LQELRPLQSCFAEAVSVALAPALELELHPMLVMVPATNPAMAAEMINVLAVRVIVFWLNMICLVRKTTPPKGTRSHTLPVSREH
jgi:hypothetical protein